jgi:hypothetical protein
MKKTAMVRFLKALHNLKTQQRNEDASWYACFGTYNEHNEACVRQAFEEHGLSVCRVCRKLRSISSSDWISNEMREWR